MYVKFPGDAVQLWVGSRGMESFVLAETGRACGRDNTREARMHRATFRILRRNGDDIDAPLRVIPCAQALQPLVGSEVVPVACLLCPFP